MAFRDRSRNANTACFKGKSAYGHILLRNQLRGDLVAEFGEVLDGSGVQWRLGGLKGHFRHVVVGAVDIGRLPGIGIVLPHGLPHLVDQLLREAHVNLNALIGAQGLDFIINALIGVRGHGAGCDGGDRLGDLRQLLVSIVDQLDGAVGVGLNDVAVRGGAGLDGAHDLAVAYASPASA